MRRKVPPLPIISFSAKPTLDPSSLALKLLLPMIPKLHLGLFLMRGHRWVGIRKCFQFCMGVGVDANEEVDAPIEEDVDEEPEREESIRLEKLDVLASSLERSKQK